LYSLADVDEYRTDEKKVAKNTFMIFDKTCGTYEKIPEDSRKGKDREFVGIIPVVTTAANALYAQNLIQVEPQNAKYYEVIGNIVPQAKENAGISTSYVAYNNGVYEDKVLGKNGDLSKQLNSVFKNYQPKLMGLSADIVTIGDIPKTIAAIIDEQTTYDT
jgi:hypothetical protein